ncbi:hypothetical protein BMJ22_20485 [Sinorhizobium medicae]|nr:hypothetical protein BMJ22_20485 [Sinorhizobium medicae]
MEALVPIITQLIAGAAGGNAASAMLKQQAFSVVARTIVGAIGGLGGGFLIQMLGGEAAATGLAMQAIGAGFLSQMLGGEAAATGLAMQAIGALVGGGVLNGIVGQFVGKRA